MPPRGSLGSSVNQLSNRNAVAAHPFLPARLTSATTPKAFRVISISEHAPNTSEVLFRLRANTSLQRDSTFILQSRNPSDVLDHANSEIAIGSKPGIDLARTAFRRKKSC